MNTLSSAIAFVLVAGALTAMQEKDAFDMAVLKEDGSSSSVCTFVVNQEERWTVELPLLGEFDWDTDGHLAGIGELHLVYGSQRHRASALVIVNSKGRCVLLEAQIPVTSWPHGTVYPTVLGCHALMNAAVFRVVTGPASGERWKIYDSETGAKINELNPNTFVASLLPSGMRVVMGPVMALKRAQLFVVGWTSAGRSAGHGLAAMALVDLEGHVRWRRLIEAEQSVELLDVESSDGGYEVLVSHAVGSEKARGVLRVNRLNAEWIIDDAAW